MARSHREFTDPWGLRSIDHGSTMPVREENTSIKKIRDMISETITIITIPAHALVEEKEKFIGIGANDYISKNSDKEN